MLNALKNLKYRGGKEGLIFFICDVIGINGIKISDAAVVCSHTPEKRCLDVESLIKYCSALGWIRISDGFLILKEEIKDDIVNREKVNLALIISTIKQLFKEEIIDADMFCFDAVSNDYLFKNELLPLEFACIRNVLISQGFFIPIRSCNLTSFHINNQYNLLIAELCKESRKKQTLEELKKKIEENEHIGERAEIFVLEYEKKRIGMPLCKGICRISEVDVRAGYDIVSYNSKSSKEFDRFIEVKAISKDGFYWSKNEYTIAKLKGNCYYLYLVELNKINQQNYIPVIIQNPAEKIMKSDEWLIETQSYLIKPIIKM